MNQSQPFVYLAATLVVSIFPGTAPAQESDYNLEELQIIQKVEIAEKVTNPFDDDLAKLNFTYLSRLEQELAAAKAAADLDASLSLDAELKRLANKEPLPVGDDETTAALRKLRTIYRTELAKLEARRLAEEAALLPRYLLKLKDLEIRLTKEGNLEDAKTVQIYRKGLIAEIPDSVIEPAMAKGDSPPERPTPGQKRTELPGNGFKNPEAWETMRDNPAGIKVANQKSHLLKDGLSWGKYTWTGVPRKLIENRAEIFLQEGFPAGISEFTVTRDGWLIIGVNYSYQGNNSGDWQDTRWDLKKFESEGWQVINDEDAGGSLIKDNDVRTEKRSQTLLARFVNQGESLILRCNKYDPPFLIVLGK